MKNAPVIRHEKSKRHGDTDVKQVGEPQKNALGEGRVLREKQKSAAAEQFQSICCQLWPIQNPRRFRAANPEIRLKNEGYRAGGRALRRTSAIYLF